MLNINGVCLKPQAEAVPPAALTVFVTGTDGYAEKALRVRAQGYVIKPVTRGGLRESMSGAKIRAEGSM